MLADLIAKCFQVFFLILLLLNGAANANNMYESREMMSGKVLRFAIFHVSFVCNFRFYIK